MNEKNKCAIDQIQNKLLINMFTTKLLGSSKNI